MTYLTVTDVVRELGGRVAPSTIRRAIASGRLYAERPGRRFLIPIDAFNRFRASAAERATEQRSFQEPTSRQARQRSVALFAVESDIDAVMRALQREQ